MQVNGHKVSLGTVIAVLTMLAGLAASWFVWGQQAGKLEQKVQTVEERQKEDRRETKQAVKEMQTDVKAINETVNKILIKLEAQEQRRDRGR